LRSLRVLYLILGVERGVDELVLLLRCLSVGRSEVAGELLPDRLVDLPGAVEEGEEGGELGQEVVEEHARVVRGEGKGG
jgi:hypothetical protein